MVLSIKVPISLLIIGIILTLFLNTNYLLKGINAKNSKVINFDFLFNNTVDLGKPFLDEYDNTTGLKPMGIRTADVGSEDFEVTFSGFGIIKHANNTIRYSSSGSGTYITNPDRTVSQKGIIQLTAEAGNDTARAEYESIGNQAGEEKVLDNGVMFFNSSSSNGKLSFLNDTIAVYKDMITNGGFSITTIAWHWE